MYTEGKKYNKISITQHLQVHTTLSYDNEMPICLDTSVIVYIAVDTADIAIEWCHHHFMKLFLAFQIRVFINMTPAREERCSNA